MHRLQATSSPDEPGCLLFLTTFYHPTEPFPVPPATGVIGNHIFISNSAQCREPTGLTDPYEKIYHGFLLIAPNHQRLFGIQKTDSSSTHRILLMKLHNAALLYSNELTLFKMRIAHIWLSHFLVDVRGEVDFNSLECLSRIRGHDRDN